MTEDELEKRLARWMADEAAGRVPEALREPAHELATRQPSIRVRRASPALGRLAIGATLVAALVIGLRGLAPVGTPDTSASPVAPGTSAASADATGPAPTLAPRSIPPVVRSDWTTVTWSLADRAPFAGPGNQFIQDIAAVGDGFVAAGYELDVTRTAIVWASAPGQPWTRVTDETGTFKDSVIDRLVVVPDGLIAIGRPGGDNAPGTRLWASSNGRDWRRLPVDTDTFGLVADPGVEVVAGPGGLLAWTRQRDGSGTNVWRSTDGLTWTVDTVTSAMFADADVSIAATLRGLVATGTRPVGTVEPDSLLGPDGVGVAWTSVDGVTWIEATVEGAHSLGPAMVARDGLLAAGSSHGPTRAISVRTEYWGSPDGGHWTPRDVDPPVTLLYVHLASDGDRLYALSPNGTWWSADGRTWQPLGVFVRGFAGQDLWGLYRFAAGPGGLVAGGQTEIGASGKADDHTDGLIWQAIPGTPPADAVPMPTPAPQNDTPCASPFLNPDGTCG